MHGTIIAGLEIQDTTHCIAHMTRASWISNRRDATPGLFP